MFTIAAQLILFLLVLIIYRFTHLYISTNVNILRNHMGWMLVPMVFLSFSKRVHLQLFQYIFFVVLVVCPYYFFDTFILQVIMSLLVIFFALQATAASRLRAILILKKAYSEAIESNPDDVESNKEIQKIIDMSQIEFMATQMDSKIAQYQLEE